MGQLGWFYPPTIPGVNHQVEDLRGRKRRTSDEGLLWSWTEDTRGRYWIESRSSFMMMMMMMMMMMTYRNLVSETEQHRHMSRCGYEAFNYTLLPFLNELLLRNSLGFTYAYSPKPNRKPLVSSWKVVLQTNFGSLVRPCLDLFTSLSDQAHLRFLPRWVHAHLHSVLAWLGWINAVSRKWDAHDWSNWSKTWGDRKPLASRLR